MGVMMWAKSIFFQKSFVNHISSLKCLQCSIHVSVCLRCIHFLSLVIFYLNKHSSMTLAIHTWDTYAIMCNKCSSMTYSLPVKLDWAIQNQQRKKKKTTEFGNRKVKSDRS